MKKQQIIKEIIKMQAGSKHFVGVAKESDLELLNRNELNMVFNATFNITRDER